MKLLTGYEFATTMGTKKSVKEKKIPCTVAGCTATFPRPSKLAIHLQLHEGKNPFQCDVKSCGKSFTTKAHLKRHKNVQHSTEIREDKPKVECTIEGCTKLYGTKGAMQRHIKLDHEGLKHILYAEKVQCTVEGCSKYYSTKSHMVRHVNRVHKTLNDSEFQCEICRKIFTEKKLFLEHTSYHIGEFYFKCSLCGNGFRTSKECNRHKATHTKYKCDQCALEFEKWSAFRKHRSIHLPIHKCKQCEFKTKIRQQLINHEEIHLDINDRKLFHCTYENCSRSYLQLTSLTFHIRCVHEGVMTKRLYCPHKNCKSSFTYPSKLKKHLLVAHSALPVVKLSRPRKPRKDRGKWRKTNIVTRLVASSIMAGTQKTDEDEGRTP